MQMKLGKSTKEGKIKLMSEIVLKLITETQSMLKADKRKAFDRDLAKALKKLQ